jgi:hypothetical protein
VGRTSGNSSKHANSQIDRKDFRISADLHRQIV